MNNRQSVFNNQDQVQSKTWPVFEPNKYGSFWQRPYLLRQRSPGIDALLFRQTFKRIGKRNKQVKQYLYELYSDGNFIYYEEQSQLKVKGFIKLDLTVKIQIDIQPSEGEQIFKILFSWKNGAIRLYLDSRESTLNCYFQLQKFCLSTGFNTMYDIYGVLGEGGFGKVYKVKYFKNNQTYFAAKVYNKEQIINSKNPEVYYVQRYFVFIYQTMLKNEIFILKELNHPYIVKLYGVYQEESKLILILELIDGETLYSYIRQKKVREEDSKKFLVQITESLQYLHSLGYVHRDLKPQNIVVSQKMSIKIIDFGFAEQINRTKLNNQSGTPGYIPPEIFEKHPYLEKGDVFQLGVIIYILLSGTSPFRGKTVRDITIKNKRCEIKFKQNIWKSVSPNCLKLIKSMLHRSISSRIDCNAILNSAWVQNDNKYELISPLISPSSGNTPINSAKYNEDEEDIIVNDYAQYFDQFKKRKHDSLLNEECTPKNAQQEIKFEDFQEATSVIQDESRPIICSFSNIVEKKRNLVQYNETTKSFVVVDQRQIRKSSDGYDSHISMEDGLSLNNLMFLGKSQNAFKRLRIVIPSIKMK